MGTLLATGIEELTPVIVPPAVNLGLEIGKGIVGGIYEAIKASPWAAMLLGAYTGAKIGSVIPGVGTAAGAGVGAGIGLATWGIPKAGEALGKHIPGSGYYTQERLAEYERAEQMFEGRRAVTPAGEPLFPGTTLRAVPKRAAGGIYSRPHTALVAEAGPEAIIPLSGRMRNRGIDLWKEAGGRLGVGAIGGSSISVTNNISVSVNRSNADPDEIAEAIAVKLERSYQNRPRKYK